MGAVPLVWVSLAGAGLDCLLNGLPSMFNVVLAGTIAAGLVHMVVATEFSTAAKGQRPNARILFKLFLLSHLLISHWSKQVTQPSPYPQWERTTQERKYR